MNGIPESAADPLRRAMREALVRSLYFDEMAARWARRGLLVRSLALAFSSGAAAAALRDTWPAVVPAGLAAGAAIATLWSLCAGLGPRAARLAVLRASWEALRDDYGGLRSNWREAGGTRRFEALRRRGSALGPLAAAGVPWDRKAARRWERFVDSELQRDGPPPAGAG